MKSRWNSNCAQCLLRKHLTAYPETATEEERLAYMSKIFALLTDVDPQVSSPVLVEQINKFKKEMFGIYVDFTDIKQYFNELMLKQEDWIRADIAASEDPLYRAIQYVMTGNYIDFGAMSDVSSEKLFELLSNAKDQTIDPVIYQELLQELAAAKKLVLLADNCGEIVLDKILLQTIQAKFPELSIQVIVRGAQAANDATMEDAIQVGLTEVAPVTGNGTAMTGTYLPAISEESRSIIEEADVILSKGQGNFESLQHCGLNIYYIFLCKCELFTKRFHTKLYEGMLISEKSLANI